MQLSQLKQTPLRPARWSWPLLPQGRCYDVIHWRHFPALVVAVVLLNTAFQMTSWAAEPRSWHTGLEVTNYVCMCGMCAGCSIVSSW